MYRKSFPSRTLFAFVGFWVRYTPEIWNGKILDILPGNLFSSAFSIFFNFFLHAFFSLPRSGQAGTRIGICGRGQGSWPKKAHARLGGAAERCSCDRSLDRCAKDRPPPAAPSGRGRCPERSRSAREARGDEEANELDARIVRTAELLSGGLVPPKDAQRKQKSFGSSGNHEPGWCLEATDRAGEFFGQVDGVQPCPRGGWDAGWPRRELNRESWRGNGYRSVINQHFGSTQVVLSISSPAARPISIALPRVILHGSKHMLMQLVFTCEIRHSQTIWYTTHWN